MWVGLSSVFMATTVSAEQKQQPDFYEQSYALYVLYHPKNKDQSRTALVKQFSQDFSALFQQHKKVNETQFVQFEQSRLEPLLKQRRDLSLKQAHVRFGVLNTNKDQQLTLKEFQASGMKTFDEMDKNQDGIINAEDLKLSANQKTGTHDGFRVKLPISMPMANTVQEFIDQYGQGKNYVTLGDYLSARDQQFFTMDTQHKNSVNEQEYVDEFMQRYDQNTMHGKVKMNDFYKQQFHVISNGKPTIQKQDIEKFAQKIDEKISQ